MNHIISFKKEVPFEERLKRSSNVLSMHPDKLPIYVEKSLKCKYDISKKKFLVPIEFKLCDFLQVLRKSIKVSPTEALYLFINNKILCINENIKTIYHSNKDSDGFLYITYGTENTFG